MMPAATVVAADPDAIYKDMVFTTVTPCVIFDSRPAFGGTGKFDPEEQRAFDVVGNIDLSGQGGNAAGCGVPGFAGSLARVQAIFVNLIAIEAESAGTVKAWASDKLEPVQGAFVNYQALTPPMNNSNAVAIELRQDNAGEDITVKNRTGKAHIRGVVVGYWSQAILSGALRFGAEEGSSGLYFFNGGSMGGEWMIWNDSFNWFEFSGPMDIQGNALVRGELQIGTPADHGAFAWVSPNQIFTMNNLASNGDVMATGRLTSSGGIVTDGFVSINDDLSVGSPGDGIGDGFFGGSLIVEGDISGDTVGGTSGFFYNGITMGSLSNPIDVKITNLDGDLRLERDPNNTQADGLDNMFRVFTNGTIEQMRIQDADEATTYFDGLVTANGLDYAESFQIRDETLSQGEVVSFDLDRPGFVNRADAEYATGLAGVISSKPGFVTGSSFDAEDQADPEIARLRDQARMAKDTAAEKRYMAILIEKKERTTRHVALAGRVPVRVDGSYGPVRPGDYLTSSPTPGHAMVMTRPGPTIGMALEAFDSDQKGSVLVFVQSGWHGQPRSPEVGRPDRAVGEQAESIERTASRPDSPTRAIAPDVAPMLNAATTLAENHVVSEAVEVGDVLVVDEIHPGSLRRANRPDDPTVVGVVADDRALVFGRGLNRGDGKPVATVGTVLVKVDARYSPIAVGDLLSTSATPGFAMRSATGASGTIMGKALDPLSNGTGVIRMLVMLR
jgi:hypothetical protein